MTVINIINKVDSLEPNQYTKSNKLAWLNRLDGQIFQELILTHVHEPDASFTPYTEDSDVLLVPFPYDEDVYLNYLKAMIAENNHEIAKYNASMMLYNSAYQRYAGWYNRNVLPVNTMPHGRHNRLHF